MNRPMEPDPHTQGLKAWHFIKASRALADPGATVKISGVSDQVDWEVELAAVIGRAAKNVPEDKALDLRGRLYRGQRPFGARPRTPCRTSPTPRRSRPTGPSTRASTAPARSGPGSCRRATSAIPQNLGLKLWVNDVLKQDSNTQGHDLQPGRADRPPVERDDASSRRPDPDGNAGRGRRRRAASSSSPATWSRSGSRRSARLSNKMA